MRYRLSTFLSSFAASALLISSAAAQGAIALETLTFGLTSPVAAEAPLGDDRIFVVEQAGRVRLFKNGFLQGASFLELTGKVAFGGERGMFDIAFHPEYSKNGQFFVSYSNFSGATVVERFRVSGFNPDLADASTGQVILSVPQPAANHNGGALEFGPDGHLYIGLGDGGGSADPSCNGQNLGTLLGKILRIDVDPIDFTGTYAIPPDNPFAFTPGARPEIFASGLRNPWRFSFDRENGNLMIGDVGEFLREEVSVSPLGSKGLNFGWPVMEGNLCFGGSSCAFGTPGCFHPAFRAPIHDYDHNPYTGGCSVIGGYVYRGSRIPGLQGSYFFGDFCSGKVWTLLTDGFSSFSLLDRTAELAGPGGSVPTVTSFGEDGHGEILLVTFGGELRRVIPAGAVGTTPNAQAKFERVSISSGAQQQIAVEFGPGLAFQPYILLGSLSGTSPGFSSNGVFIPLNWDAYFTAALGGQTSSITVGELGLLDGNGETRAGFVAPGGALPFSLVGQTLHQSVLAVNSFSGLLAASSPVRLSFVF